MQLNIGLRPTILAPIDLRESGIRQDRATIATPLARGLSYFSTDTRELQINTDGTEEGWEGTLTLPQPLSMPNTLTAFGAIHRSRTEQGLTRGISPFFRIPRPTAQAFTVKATVHASIKHDNGHYTAHSHIVHFAVNSTSTGALDIIGWDYGRAFPDADFRWYTAYMNRNNEGQQGPLYYAFNTNGTITVSLVNWPQSNGFNPQDPSQFGFHQPDEITLSEIEGVSPYAQMISRFGNIVGHDVVFINEPLNTDYTPGGTSLVRIQAHENPHDSEVDINVIIDTNETVQATVSVEACGVELSIFDSPDAGVFA